MDEYFSSLEAVFFLPLILLLLTCLVVKLLVKCLFPQKIKHAQDECNEMTISKFQIENEKQLDGCLSFENPNLDSAIK
jgi:hypothetical protein